MIGWVLIPLALAGALVTGAPTLLTRGSWQIRFPRLALSLWFLALGGGCVSALTALVAAIHFTVTRGPTAELATSIVLTIATWCALVAVGAILGHVLAVGHLPRPVSLAGEVISRDRRGGLELVRFRCEAPIVCTTGFGARAIWVASAAEQRLSPAELQAVLAHEYAHLRYHHHVATWIAGLNARILPRQLQAGRELAQATNLLVELVADDAAARQVGAAAVANALRRLADQAPGMALRAERVAGLRWPKRRRRHVPSAIRLTSPQC